MSTISFLVLAGLCLALVTLEQVPEVSAKFWDASSAGHARTESFNSGAGGAASSTRGRDAGGAASSTKGRDAATGIGLHRGAIISSYFGGTGNSTGGRSSALGTTEFGRDSSASIVYGGAGSSSDRGSATRTASTGYRGYMGGAGGLGGGHPRGTGGLGARHLIGAGGLGARNLGESGALGAGNLGGAAGGYLGGSIEADVGSQYIGSGYDGGFGGGFLGSGGGFDEAAVIAGAVVGGYAGFGNDAVNEYELEIAPGGRPVYPVEAPAPLAVGGIGGYDNFQHGGEFVSEGFGGYGGGYFGEVGLGSASVLPVGHVGTLAGDVRLFPYLL